MHVGCCFIKYPGFVVMAGTFKFAVDRGGTFTDVYAELPGRKSAQYAKCDPLVLTGSDRARRILIGLQMGRATVC